MRFVRKLIIENSRTILPSSFIIQRLAGRFWLAIFRGAKFYLGKIVIVIIPWATFPALTASASKYIGILKTRLTVIRAVITHIGTKLSIHCCALT
jgi:hypothetical protein